MKPWVPKFLRSLFRTVAPTTTHFVEFVPGLRKLIEGHNRFVKMRINEAITISEREVIKVGDCVHDLLTQANEQAKHSERIAEELGQDSQIFSAIARQNESIATFISNMTTELERQRAIAEEAAKQSDQIVLAGANIQQIAKASKLLNINAQIEAARLGPAGIPFLVIAQEMSNLSRDVETTNKIIGDLAIALTECMPQLSKITKSISKIAQSFGTDTVQKLNDVRSAQEHLQSILQSSLKDNEKRAESMLARSREALTHLQFQDPMAQGLRQAQIATQTLVGQLKPLFGPHEALSASAAPSPPTLKQLDHDSKSGGGFSDFSNLDGFDGSVPKSSNPMASLAKEDDLLKITGVSEPAHTAANEEPLKPASGDMVLW